MGFIGVLADSVLSLILLLLFLRAILSWMPSFDNKFTYYVYYFTEPFLIPSRNLLQKLGIANNLPIDLSFIVSYLFILLLRSLI